jgi:glutamate carboxypeptidase
MLPPEIHTRLHTYLEKQQAAYLNLLKQMVSINSFTTNPAGVNALGRFTAEYFYDLGFKAKTVPSSNPMHGQHLILTRPGRTARKIGLVSHLDTVYTLHEEQRHNFFWREEGDRIYGPGTVDIKGGTVIIYMILAGLQAILPELYDEITWLVLLNAAEEELSDDFGQVCLQELGDTALACLVFEGGETVNGNWSVVTSRKGRASYHLTVEGKGAHAGAAHQEGANALVELAHLIQQVAGMTDYRRDLTFNVGVAAGGTVINRVPHYASAAVEMRTFSPDVFAEGMARMLAFNGQATVRSAVGNYPCRVSVKLMEQTAPWAPNPGSERLLTIWQQTARELGRGLVPEARGGLSDGNWVWQSVPTLDGLGPIGANSHCSEQSADGLKEQEYVLASSFVPKAALNALAILRVIEAGNQSGD